MEVEPIGTGVDGHAERAARGRRALADGAHMAAVGALAPFRIHSFRFQWPSNLAASWAFEMEILILGWYVLVETGSVMLLTVFGSLQWAGTFFSPLFGVVGDRIGHRRLLCIMRTFYCAQALVLLMLALTGLLNALYVFLVSAAMSMVRPSDMVMRYALVGETMPAPFLMGAMSIERTTSDSARVVGALTGAGLIAAYGMAPAYIAISAFYAVALLLTFGITTGPRSSPAAPAGADASSHWRDLLDAFGYVRRTPLLLAAMCLAFLVNMTAFPLTLGLLPYVAKDIYQTDQTGLGYLAAGFSFGALVGSLILTHRGHAIRSGRWMIVYALAWYAMLVAFAYAPSLGWGIVVLMLAGCAQSFCLVPMAALLLRHADERYRGRVIGIRMFAIYGLPLGLLFAGPLITYLGFVPMALIYCVLGAALSGWIALRWRRDLWLADAPVNRLR
jgi:predicted MFS family arabinose efflux permease